MIPYKQLSVADIFSDCQEKFENDKPAFLSLLETHIDIDEIIPISFRNHFYASTGRTRKYPLQALLWALIIQRIFSIPTDQLLLTFLAYSKPLREFCGFTKVPDASKITRFKQDFFYAFSMYLLQPQRFCYQMLYIHHKKFLWPNSALKLLHNRLIPTDGYLMLILFHKSLEKHPRVL